MYAFYAMHYMNVSSGRLSTDYQHAACCHWIRAGIGLKHSVVLSGNAVKITNKMHDSNIFVISAKAVTDRRSVALLKRTMAITIFSITVLNTE